VLNVDIRQPEDELHLWALRDFIRAWDDKPRHREKESRWDWWLGYRQGLIDAKAFERFKVRPE